MSRRKEVDATHDLPRGLGHAALTLPSTLHQGAGRPHIVPVPIGRPARPLGNLPVCRAGPFGLCVARTRWSAPERRHLEEATSGNETWRNQPFSYLDAGLCSRSMPMFLRSPLRAPRANPSSPSSSGCRDSNCNARSHSNGTAYPCRGNRGPGHRFGYRGCPANSYPRCKGTQPGESASIPVCGGTLQLASCAGPLHLARRISGDDRVSLGE